jgi:hypothetical protein
MKRLLLITFLAFVCALPIAAQTSPPVLFYSDLDSGPATGGQGGNGAFVCVYGENFGSGGTLAIGGAATTTILWKDPGAPYVPAHYAEACGQIAAGAATGPGAIQLTTSAGSSNTLPFTVRAGKIYFVSTSGSDATGDGSYENPWATITYCKNTFSPGGICVAGISSTDTITVTAAEPQSWGTVVGLLLNSCGTAGNPKTIIAYPGNSVTYDLHAWIDPSTHQKGGGRALQDYNSPSYPNNCGAGNPIAYWTIAGLRFNGNSFAAEFNGANFRVVDNTMQCTGAYCDGPSGGLVGGTGGNLVLYGNRVNQTGCGVSTACASGMSGTSKLYHSVYLGQGNNETLAYSEIIGGTACRGVQFHSLDSGGNPQQNLQIFNNVIHNTKCDGLNLTTVNPSAAGGVNVYNNIVYNAGIGPDPYDGVAHYSCFYSPAYTGNGACTGGGSGAINVYNNTFYNCGGAGLVGAGVIGALNCASVTVALNNNLIGQPLDSVVPYMSADSTGTISATSNDCFGYSDGFGATNCPSSWGGTEWSFNPEFVDAVSYDFHLNTNSRAASISVTAPAPTTDADGLTRISPNSLGAHAQPTSQRTNPSGAPVPQLTVSCEQVSYDGNPHTCTGSATGTGGIPVSGVWSFVPASESSPGLYAVTGFFTSSDLDYSGGIASATLRIDKHAPVVSFTGAPASAPYLATFTVSASTNASTNATISASGPCTNVGDAVTITAGSGTCSLVATWAADSIYLAASSKQSISTTNVMPILKWPAPVAIAYGTKLSATQLNATAIYNGVKVAGTFGYAPAAGTLLGEGPHVLSVVFTPTSTADYRPAGTSVILPVNSARPNIIWATPAAIKYGTALSGAQLKASASVPGTFAYSPSGGTMLTGGAHTLSVTFTPTDTTDYTTATDAVQITVSPAAPTITWAKPSSITFGTALSSTQLNATTAVPGSFIYSPAAGKVLAGGPHTLSVTFAPTDTTNYQAVTETNLITVNAAVPTIAWANPSAITYGTALSSTQLSATAPVPGSFTYSPAAGTVLTGGTHTLSVTFAPTDTTDYKTKIASVTIIVDKAAPTLTWPVPAEITYSTPLSGKQLNATASLPGHFIYSPAAGTVPAGGLQILSVTFTPTDTTNYATAKASVMLHVNPVTPTITWAAPAEITYGTKLSATQLNATATYNGAKVAGSFAYTPAKNTVLGAGAQTLSVVFTPLKTANYAPASTSVILQVNPARPNITWAAPPAINYGTALSSTQLKATASVPGTFAYSPSGGTVLMGGTHTLSLTFAPTDTTDYTTATAANTIVVNKISSTTAVATTVRSPSLAGQSVTVSFNVTGKGVPTGTVSVAASTGEKCTATLSTGEGSCSLTFSTSGKKALTATYLGDTNFKSSTSGKITQEVQP